MEKFSKLKGDIIYIIGIVENEQESAIPDLLLHATAVLPELPVLPVPPCMHSYQCYIATSYQCYHIYQCY